MQSLFNNIRKPRSEASVVDPQPVQRVEAPIPAKPIIAPERPEGFQTVLGAGSRMDGKLRAEGNIRLDGKFVGALEITGNVLIGQPANITADIHAKNISIAGAVRGNVVGDKVQLLRTARVWGDITAVSLKTEEGALIDGKISMITRNEADQGNLDDLMAGPGDEDEIEDHLDSPTIMQPLNIDQDVTQVDVFDTEDLDGPTIMINPDTGDPSGDDDD